MTFGEKLKHAAFGCLCTLAGVLFTSFVLTLFAESGENVSYDHVMCKMVTILGEDDNPIAILSGMSGSGEIGGGDYGTLTLTDKNRDRTFFLTNYSLLFSTNGQEVVELGVDGDSGKLLLNSSKDDGTTIIADTEEGFAVGVFGPKGVGSTGGASLSIKDNKGQLILFGENSEILFSRGEITYGE